MPVTTFPEYMQHITDLLNHAVAIGWVRIAHGEVSNAWGQHRRALCRRSPAILAAEPTELGAKQHWTIDFRTPQLVLTATWRESPGHAYLCGVSSSG